MSGKKKHYAALCCLALLFAVAALEPVYAQSSGSSAGLGVLETLVTNLVTWASGKFGRSLCTLAVMGLCIGGLSGRLHPRSAFTIAGCIAGFASAANIANYFFDVGGAN